MRTYFRDYSCGFRLCGVAKSVQSKLSYIQDSLNVLEFQDGNWVLHIKNRIIHIIPVDEEKLSRLHDYDVLLIHDNGIVESVYSADDDAVLFITSLCNSNCIMCPSSLSSRLSGSVERLKLLLELIKYLPRDVEHITITGGEPLLMGEDIFTLLVACKERFETTPFLLLTNGRGFCNREFVMSFSKSAPNNITVAIPIHASSSDMHDAITQVDGSFRQTILGVKNLLSLGFSVEIRIVVSRLNAHNILETTIMLMDELKGNYKIHFVGLEMTGNAAVSAEDIWIPYNEAFCFIKPAIDLLVANGVDVELYNFPLCAVDSGYFSICAKSISPEKVFKDNAECEECSLKEACGGVFRGSYRFAKSEIRRVVRS